MNQGSRDYSDEKAYRIAYLISGYIRKTLTEAEHDELDRWVEASDENMLLFEELTNEAHIAVNLAWMDAVGTEKALETKLAKIRSTTPRKKTYQMGWGTYAAAASLILAVVAIYFIARVSSKSSETQKVVTRSDVPTGSNRATLTLSNGHVVDLVALDEDSIAAEKGISIRKTADGQLMYTKTSEPTTTSFNTLATPKGGQYAITLEDGTKVWLNAASSLRYPIHFEDSLRIVELQGEGYFEVASNARQPFIVRLAGGKEVRVVGTQFNVMAYQEDEKKEITLVEGKVRVKNAEKRRQLKPGQQAVMKEDDLVVQTVPHMDAAVGWRKGAFVFHDASVYELMRQIERWYDVNVIYRTTSSEHFNFTISRKEPLSKILTLMELTGKIHFKTDNKTVYVLP